MTDTLQNSRSSFRELRLAAGLGRTAIAKPLKIWAETVGQWDHGKRPAWRYMLALSKLLGIDLNETVRMMWGEIVGDSCPCQCGGKKVFPDYDGALHLSIRLPCVKCGAERPPFRTPRKHAKECRICSFARRGKSPPLPSFPVRCVGYRPYGAKAPLFANGCQRDSKIRPSQLKESRNSGTRIIRGRLKMITRSQRTSDNELQGTFVNRATGEYRCNRCAGAMTLIRTREERVREFWKKAKPHENALEIRSLKRLEALEKECFSLSFKDESGAIVTFNPHLE